VGFVPLGCALVELASKVGNDLLRIGQNAVRRKAHLRTSSGPSSLADHTVIDTRHHVVVDQDDRRGVVE
jgi:hypothetical protein